MLHLLFTVLHNRKIQSNYILFFVCKKVSKYKVNTVAEGNFVVTSMYRHGTGIADGTRSAAFVTL